MAETFPLGPQGFLALGLHPERVFDESAQLGQALLGCIGAPA